MKQLNYKKLILPNIPYTSYIEPNSGYARTAFHTGKVEREIPRCKTGLAACGQRHIGGTKRLYSHSPSVKSVAGIG